jgi:hypothetical protein
MRTILRSCCPDVALLVVKTSAKAPVSINFDLGLTACDGVRRTIIAVVVLRIFDSVIRTEHLQS